METAWKAGLEDVIAGRSAICRVDGEAGRLYYRGYEVGDLTAHAPFEDVTALLWLGELPAALESERFKARLAAARGLPAPVRDLLQSLPRDTHPLDALRTAVSLAATFDPDTRASDPEANFRKAVRLTALVPETVAAWQRIRNGKAPVSAPTSLSHAAYFLNLVDGRAPSPEVARVLDVVLTLHADHELNASTFAARVAVATLADLHAAIVSAISTLKGPRHGGANEDVLAMLLEIGQPARAERFVESRLGARAGLSKHERGNPQMRVPGFGHRVYRVDVDVVAAAVVTAAGGAHVFEVRRHFAAGDARVVGDDDRARHELRLELAHVVEVVLLFGVDEGEVEAAGQERDRPQRVAGHHLHSSGQPRLRDVRAHEPGQAGIRLDAREPALRWHGAGDQDRRVAEQRAELDGAGGTMTVEQPANDAALDATDGRDVPARRRPVHQREHPARLFGHARAAGRRAATVSGRG